MSENRELRRIFGPKRDEVIGGRKFSSPNIIRMIKSRRIRWAGYVACTECIQGFGGKG
jgi:hypothetical protein